MPSATLLSNGSYRVAVTAGRSGRARSDSATSPAPPDLSPFTNQDAVKAAWSIVDRVLVDHPPCLSYAPGTLGQAAAAELIASAVPAVMGTTP
jgi:hypothetical protein